VLAASGGVVLLICRSLPLMARGLGRTVACRGLGMVVGEVILHKGVKEEACVHA
jgi:hypothetical protein